MSGLRTPVDLCNRALQILRRPSILTFNDASVEAHEMAAAYPVMRLAELRRALWVFSTRRVVLRPVANTTMYMVPVAWDISTEFFAGDIVDFDNQFWVALVDNTGQQPGLVPAGGTLYWDSYFGPLTLDLFGINNATTYQVGELVYINNNDGTYAIYRSLIQNNANNPVVVDLYDSGKVYQLNQIVALSGVNYQSLINFNYNNQPDISSAQWSTTISGALRSYTWEPMVTMTLAPLNVIWPLGTGPADDPATRNIFRKPASFLRQTVTDPRAGQTSMLGAPTAPMATDWLFEGDWIVSEMSDPIMLRFICDIQNVPSFDALFGIALSTRLAIELAPRLVDAEMLPTLLADAREEYARTISEARTINAIEIGSEEPDQDDFIVCRI